MKCFKYILFCLVAILLLAGCSDDVLFTSDGDSHPGEELPIEFDILCPDALGSRADGTEDIGMKKSFKPGDVIHIIGTFNITYYDENSSAEDGLAEGVVTRYGALQYTDKKKWVAAEGNELTWPATATDGKFKAYYVSGSDGVLTMGKPLDPIPLTKVMLEADDPLYAETEENEPIVYGHAVKLKFQHLCAHLTLIDLEPMVAENYFFYGKPKDPATGEEVDFNNAFTISLSQDENGAPKLDFEFCQYKDPNYGNNDVYISAKAVEGTMDGKTITKVGYLLEPGLYDAFTVAYPATISEVYNYLQYDYNQIPDEVGGVDVTKTLPDLKANHAYRLTVTKSPGITITSPPSAEGWDESDDYYDVDVEEFLKAVREGTDYFNEQKTQILQQTANGTKLLHNVDFKDFDYYQEGGGLSEGFVPNVPASVVFDGDFHYIRNLASSLFRYNYGTIQNVGIRTTKINITSKEEYVPEDDISNNTDMSRHGALCMWNRQGGTINNVRVIDVNMTVRVHSDIEIDTPDSDGSETHNIGGVLGSNTGTVSEVSLGGKFELTVLNEENNDMNSSVLIGGFVGQNAAGGNISEVSPVEGSSPEGPLSISLINQCAGSVGSYSVGGIVGESSGTITGVILSNVTIDGTASEGVVSYMGGIAGKLEASNTAASESSSSMTSCIVGGTVKAGTILPYGDITSASYIGGIAGVDLHVPVQDCRTAVSVYAPEVAEEKVLYATGGAFGRIRVADTYTFENLIAYGAALEYPKPLADDMPNYVGNFVGIAPEDHTWDKDYADKNIIIHSFPGIENIGHNLDN